jgi:hypothetical protein
MTHTPSHLPSHYYCSTITTAYVITIITITTTPIPPPPLLAQGSQCNVWLCDALSIAAWFDLRARCEIHLQSMLALAIKAGECQICVRLHLAFHFVVGARLLLQTSRLQSVQSCDAFLSFFFLHLFLSSKLTLMHIALSLSLSLSLSLIHLSLSPA